MVADMTDVSVIIPVYNGAETIARAVRSVLAQDYRSYELIVVDDGSTDSTGDVVRGFGSGIQYIRQENRGPAAARNAGAKIASGEYLAFLDADDEWLPSKLTSMVAVFDQDGDASLVYSNFVSIALSGEVSVKRYSGVGEDVPRILPSCTIMKRGVFDACGGFCEEFTRPGYEDPYLWYLAREHGHFVYVPESLTRYRRPSNEEAVIKYSDGRKLLMAKLRQRNDKDTRQYVRRMNRVAAAQFVAAALAKMDAGDVRGAFLRWIWAVQAAPSHVFAPAIAARIFRMRNIKRIADAFIRQIGRTRPVPQSDRDG
jgi:glycosyltransferase involved in cell wall biosynthesis